MKCFDRNLIVAFEFYSMQTDSPAASPSVLGSPPPAKIGSPLLPNTPGPSSSDNHSPFSPKQLPTVITNTPQKVSQCNQILEKIPQSGIILVEIYAASMLS